MYQKGLGWEGNWAKECGNTFAFVCVTLWCLLADWKQQKIGLQRQIQFVFYETRHSNEDSIIVSVKTRKFVYKSSTLFVCDDINQLLAICAENLFFCLETWQNAEKFCVKWFVPFFGLLFTLLIFNLCLCAQKSSKQRREKLDEKGIGWIRKETFSNERKQ